jgi:hypothetical protein
VILLATIQQGQLGIELAQYLRAPVTSVKLV